MKLFNRTGFIGISAFGLVSDAVARLSRSLIGARDRVYISLELHGKQLEQGARISVQNLSQHRVTLSDIGFIDAKGRQFSLIQNDDASSGGDDHLHYGPTTLDSREIYSGSFRDMLDALGVYAFTINQTYPRILFNQQVKCWKRLKIRWMIYKSFFRGYSYWMTPEELAEEEEFHLQLFETGELDHHR